MVTRTQLLFRCGNSAGLSQKALLELLMKSTQVFREEYIAKQSKARGELLHHMTLLQVTSFCDLVIQWVGPGDFLSYVDPGAEHYPLPTEEVWNNSLCSLSAACNCLQVASNRVPSPFHLLQMEISITSFT